MKSIPSLFIFSLLLALVPTTTSGAPETITNTNRATLTFAGVEYFHRWSQDDLHEYTPKGQTNLDRWSDMISINYHRSATNGDGLARVANGTFANYQNAQAVVLKVESVPRTEEKPAEHLIVVSFARPEFIEASFARLKIVEDIGTAAIYGHREHGKEIKEIGDRMSAWLKTNGPAIEKALMSWTQIPPLETKSVIPSEKQKVKK
jgi:hypothetical protein